MEIELDGLSFVLQELSQFGSNKEEGIGQQDERVHHNKEQGEFHNVTS
jgi:hypothetical protein